MRAGPSKTLLAHKAINLADDLSGTEKRVLAAIIDHYNSATGQCDPSLGTIANLLQISRRTVIRAIDRLVAKRYLEKLRHGGKFHRNSYAPVWSRFEAVVAAWKDKRVAPRSAREATGMSPSQGQSCHVAGDSAGTQTFLTNLLDKTSAEAASQDLSRQLPETSGSRRPGKVTTTTPSYSIANEGFHVKSRQAQEADRRRAERRWIRALAERHADRPNLFGDLLNAIDDALHQDATDAELRDPGRGHEIVLRRLHRIVGDAG